MKQVLNGTSVPNREGHYDYMLRRMREQDAIEGIDHRTPDQKIAELTERIKQLEVDMAHVIAQK